MKIFLLVSDRCGTQKLDTEKENCEDNEDR